MNNGRSENIRLRDCVQFGGGRSRRDWLWGLGAELGLKALDVKTQRYHAKMASADNIEAGWTKALSDGCAPLMRIVC